MAYTPYYTGGWQSGEEGGTPITPDALNHMEEGIEDANTLDATPTKDSTKAVQSGGVFDAIAQSTAYQSSNNAGFLRGARDHYGLSDQAVFVVSVIDDSESNVYVGIFWFKYGSEIYKVDLLSKGISYNAGNSQGTIAFNGITGNGKYMATRIG